MLLLLRISARVEHGGYVAIAASDVFSLNHFQFLVNALLLISGTAALAYDLMRFNKD